MDRIVHNWELELVEKRDLVIPDPDWLLPQGISQISVIWLQSVKKLIFRIFLNLNCLPSESGAIGVHVRSTDNEQHSLHPHCSCLKTLLCNRRLLEFSAWSITSIEILTLVIMAESSVHSLSSLCFCTNWRNLEFLHNFKCHYKDFLNYLSRLPLKCSSIQYSAMMQSSLSMNFATAARTSW